MFKSVIATKWYWLICDLFSDLFVSWHQRDGGSGCPDEYYQRRFKNSTPSFLPWHLALLRWIRVTAEVTAPGSVPISMSGCTPDFGLEYLLFSLHTVLFYNLNLQSLSASAGLLPNLPFHSILQDILHGDLFKTVKLSMPSAVFPQKHKQK